MNSEILEYVFFGNSVLDYLISLGIFAGGVLVLIIFKNIALSNIKKWAKSTKTEIDDLAIRMIEKNIMPLLYFGALYLGLQKLALPQSISKIILMIGVIVATIMGIRVLVAIVNYTIVAIMLKRERSESRARSIKSIGLVIKIVLWGAGIVFLLDNLGFKISAIIAGLGIGGIAVALAAQTILGDLFSFFSILFDRPFEVGDFIIIGEYLGAVEYIGIKTTRIRSLGGEQLIFSNTDLTNSRVRNYKRMNERRVVFKLGVTYSTPYEKMQKIPKIIKQIITNVKDTRFDRAHFFSYGDFNLVIEVVYYVLSPDYNKYMDIQEEINLAVMQAFAKEKIEFAYPTQTLYVKKDSV
jgi:small-conductance mechanosensitive channel